jgi:hypothetical protein
MTEDEFLRTIMQVMRSIRLELMLPWGTMTKKI